MRYSAEPMPQITYRRRVTAKTELRGVDVFLHWSGGSRDELAAEAPPLVFLLEDFLLVTPAPEVDRAPS